MEAPEKLPFGAKFFALCLPVAVFAICIFFMACSSQKQAQAPQEDVKRYQLHGKIVAIDKPQRQLLIDHDTIPGFMEAMTMRYPVLAKDEHVLDTLAVDDEITAQLVVSRTGVHLENIAVVKKASDAGSSSTGDLHQLVVGEQPPDFVLVNQDNKRIPLRRYQSKALLITFLYTRCPFPDYCPLMTRNFADIEKALAKQPELYAKTHLLSISFDPEHDTPAALRAYGSKYVVQKDGHAFDHWEFAAAPAPDTKKVANFFGLGYKEEDGQILHGLNTTIISPDGKIFKWYYGNEWKVEDVLKDLEKAAQTRP